MNVAVNLYEFLKEHDSAELVGLGTFYVSTQSARISSLTGEIRPPCRKLSFKAEENNDLNFVISMADKEFISHETALVWIKQYAESVKEKIESGKKIQIGELGSLSKDFYGNYVFEASEKLNLMDNSFAFAPLKEVKTFDNNDETIDLIHTIDPNIKEEEVVVEEKIEEEPVIITIKEETFVEELPKETVEHTEAVVFSENEELKQEGEVKEELNVEVYAEETELKEVEKEVEIEDIKPADEDLREKAQAIIDASKEEKLKEEDDKDKKKLKKKKKEKKRKKRILLIILFVLLFLLLACGGLVAAHYFGWFKDYKFMAPISEKLSCYIPQKKAEKVVAVVAESQTETIVEESSETTESTTETISEEEVVLEEVKANPIPQPKPIKKANKQTTNKVDNKKDKQEETPKQPTEPAIDNSPVVVQNYSKLGCDVVSGSFKDKALAEKKARKAKSLGYDSYIINRVQGGEQVYYVSYGSRRTLEEANKLAVKIKEKIGGDFYVISR